MFLRNYHNAEGRNILEAVTYDEVPIKVDVDENGEQFYIEEKKPAKKSKYLPGERLLKSIHASRVKKSTHPTKKTKKIDYPQIQKSLSNILRHF